MKRISHAGSITSSLLCLALAGLLPGACATEANTLEPTEGSGAQSTGGQAKAASIAMRVPPISRIVAA